MKSVRDGINKAVSQAEQVASNAWPRANGGFIFADAPNAVTSAAAIVPQVSMHRNSMPPGHPIITSFEPGEHWFYDYRTQESFASPKLAALASVGSTGAGTGWSGALKLAKAASRKGGARRDLAQHHRTEPADEVIE
jgi:hypothetical protein